MTASELASHLKDCKTVISTLGHGHTFSGMFGAPYFIVRDSLKLVLDATKLVEDEKFRIILLSSISSRLTHDEPSWFQSLLMSCVLFLPFLNDVYEETSYLMVLMVLTCRRMHMNESSVWL
jgi:hypothetical protein